MGKLLQKVANGSQKLSIRENNNSLRGAQEKTRAGMASVYKLMPCLSKGEQLRFPREFIGWRGKFQLP